MTQDTDPTSAHPKSLLEAMQIAFELAFARGDLETPVPIGGDQHAASRPVNGGRSPFVPGPPRRPEASRG